MHRNPKFWKDPNSFIPERFIEGEPEFVGVNPLAWAPFGEGQRGCIGQRFALEEAKITLVKLYQKFTFELQPGQVSEQGDCFSFYFCLRGVNLVCKPAGFGYGFLRTGSCLLVSNPLPVLSEVNIFCLVLS